MTAEQIDFWFAVIGWLGIGAGLIAVGFGLFFLYALISWMNNGSH
jgi:hypothetical protein